MARQLNGFTSLQPLIVAKEVTQALADRIPRDEPEPFEAGHVRDMPRDASGAVVFLCNADFCAQARNPHQLGENGMDRGLSPARDVVCPTVLAPLREQKKSGRDVARIDEVSRGAQRTHMEHLTAG